jgi:hypothetical protein
LTKNCSQAVKDKRKRTRRPLGALEMECEVKFVERQVSRKTFLDYMNDLVKKFYQR